LIDKEFREWDGQRRRDAIQDIDGGIFLTPLHAAEIGAINARIESKALL
jgi:hypothetical protein